VAQVLIWDQLHTLSDDYQLAFKEALSLANHHVFYIEGRGE
jgi:hypothetical protein